MVFSKTGTIKSKTSVLYVENLNEVFFDVYSFKYKNEDVVVSAKKEKDEITARVFVEGFGKIPVSLKKGKSGLFISESILPQYKPQVVSKEASEIGSVITEAIEEPNKDYDVILENYKNELFDQINSQLIKSKESIKYLTENAHSFIENKIKEHGAILLSEYLGAVDALKPTIEVSVLDRVSKHSKQVDNTISHHIGNIEERFDKHSKEYKKLKKELLEYLNANKIDTDKTLEKLITETTSSSLEETKSALTDLHENVIAWNKQSKEELETINESNLNKSVRKLSSILTEETEKLKSIYNEKVEELKETVSSAQNTIKEMFASFKEDISRSVTHKLLEERKLSDFNSFKKDMNQMKADLANNYRQLRIMIDQVGGGGGTVAVQYANGGIMNGILDVYGNYLSGGIDLKTAILSVTDGRYLRYDAPQQITPELAMNFVQTMSSGNINISNPDQRGNQLEFTQTTPLSSWIIQHNFGYVPKIVIVNEDGDDIDADIEHNLPDYTSLTATFMNNGVGMPIAGIAYLD